MSEGSTMEEYRTMSFETYWRTYFPDLLEELPVQRQRCLLGKLEEAFADEQYAGREVVQRLSEVYAGTITVDQYFAWVLTEDSDDAAEHLLAHLAAGEYVRGSRVETLRVLANLEYTPGLAAAVQCAAADGVLTHEEVVDVLSCSLRNAPLPRVKDRPAHVPALPFNRVSTPHHASHHAPVPVHH